MKYAYENLSPKQFEDLVVAVCQFVLGLSVQGFAEGPDGGRDARFSGTAELHPSRAAPWIGKIIVQAKHTNGLNKKFTDSDFFSEGSTTTVIAKEIPRIARLRQDAELDYYMLFSNRHLTGDGDRKIRSEISNKCGLPVESIYLCDVEQLEFWLKHFPAVEAIANIDPIDSPLFVSPQDLAEVVEALGNHMPAALTATDDTPVTRVSYSEKNVVNNMTPAFAKELRRKYLKDTKQIRDFLANPENERQLSLYLSAVDEFQLSVLAKRGDHQSFDAVFVYLRDLLFSRDAILRRHKRLTATVLFYMYWTCDLGETPDA